MADAKQDDLFRGFTVIEAAGGIAGYARKLDERMARRALEIRDDFNIHRVEDLSDLLLNDLSQYLWNELEPDIKRLSLARAEEALLQSQADDEQTMRRVCNEANRYIFDRAMQIASAVARAVGQISKHPKTP